MARFNMLHSTKRWLINNINWNVRWFQLAFDKYPVALKQRSSEEVSAEVAEEEDDDEVEVDEVEEEDEMEEEWPKEVSNATSSCDSDLP